jgi:hypothetical protein
MFNSRKLAYAKPGKQLPDVCVELSNLYLIEQAPIEVDVIYTEAVPLRRKDALSGGHERAKVDSSELYHGALSMFLEAGFTLVKHRGNTPGTGPRRHVNGATIRPPTTDARAVGCRKR